MNYVKKLNEIRKEFKDREFEVVRYFMFKYFDSGKMRKKIRLVLKCKIDGNIWDADHYKIRFGRGCPKCKNRNLSILKSIPKKGKSFADLRPDLVKYFANKDDAKNYFLQSGKIVDMICPNCGHKKKMKISRLTYKYGFSCPICSDNISIPEKFCANILRLLNIKFENQKTFKWSERRIYDFYLPKSNMIIETHGIQHYNKVGYNKIGDFEKNKIIDKFKEENAILNGINKYIIIDCRDSDMNFLKKSFIFNLSQIDEFNGIKSIDFKEVWKKSNKSLVIEVCKFWKDSEYKVSAVFMASKFKLNEATIRKYLKIGTDIGMY